MHLVTFQPWHCLGDGQLAELVDQPLQNPPADVGMRHLAPAEEDRGLHFVPVFEEALDVLLLELVVVLVDLRSELDLFDQDDLLVLPGLPRPLLLLVLIFAEIHDAADGWSRRGRDFDQVESLLLRKSQRLWRRHDAELLAAVVDDTGFPNPNSLVDPHAVVAAGGAVKSDKGLLNLLA